MESKRWYVRMSRISKVTYHRYAVMLAEAKVDHQYVLTANQRLPQFVAAIIEEEKLEAQKAA